MIRTGSTAGRLPEQGYEAEAASLDDVRAALQPLEVGDAAALSTPQALAQDKAGWRHAVTAYEAAVQRLMANQPGARLHVRACAEQLQQQIAYLR